MKESHAPYEAETGIQSFDRTERVQAYLSRPDRYRQLFTAFSAPAVISRGAGLTYCLASASSQGASVSSKQFNRLLAFDEQSNTVLLEPGVSMGNLLQFAA